VTNGLGAREKVQPLTKSLSRRQYQDNGSEVSKALSCRGNEY